jgi:nickel transport protein
MRLLLGLCFTLLATCAAHAHSVQYHVEQKPLTVVRVFFEPDDPASDSAYQVFAPGEDVAYQKGRTDRNGFISFIPDRGGVWRVKLDGESQHGMHGVVVEVKVSAALQLESFKKPLVAQHTKVITGVSLLIGMAGIFAWLRSRKK